MTEPDSTIHGLICSGLNDAVTQTRKVFALYFISYTYIVFSLSRLSDRQILFDDTLTLPVLGVDIPLSDFFLASPILLLGLYIHMLAYLTRLSRLTNEAIESKHVDLDWINTWLTTIYVESNDTVWGIAQRGYVNLLLWLSLPIGLFALSISAARVHDEVLSPFTVCVTVIGVLTSVAGWKKCQRKEWEDVFQPSFLIISVSAIFLLAWVHASAFQGSMFELDLRGEIIWAERDTTKRFWRDLDDRNLQGANLRDADLQRVTLNDADLSRIDATNANLRSASLREAYLIQATLAYARLTDADFRKADLTGASLEFANIENANFRGAILKEANLKGINGYETVVLRNATLREVTLEGTNVDGINLSQSILDEANLSNTSLRNANLRFTSFVGADLNNTDFNGADLTSADLRKAQNVTPEQFCDAKSIRGSLPRDLFQRVRKACG